MTASQADPDPHSPTTNGLFTIPQLFRIQTTLEPSKRAARMNQWTFFNKKIEAFKAQSNDGSTPSTPVKKATPGRKRAPKAKKGGSDEQSAAQVMENQMYQAQPALPGRAPNPTPDTTERAPKGQVVVASQQVPEDQLVVAAQQHVYQPAMPYTHIVPQYPPPMPPMGYMPMLPPAMAPVAAPGGFTYMDIPQHPHLQFNEPMQIYPGPSHHGYAGPGPSCPLRRDSVLGLPV
ncbi:hypothetical protein CEK26_000132 [Fusarium fujikuroi]|nr:hypothetical protein CEK27_000131 [Fusarium fujikuroi]QGI75223.1 hypothetical protein CEK25_000129 [Fusarium fujikuroi]QGI88917.1 hypothetical protein CEK26_000132 [Fusarium fujikuroi]